jgi:flagellin-like protein
MIYMKGISAVIATLLMLVITVSLAITAFGFINNWFGSTTSQLIEVADASCDSSYYVVLRNIDEFSPIDTSNLIATVDEVPTNVVWRPNDVTGWWGMNEGSGSTTEDFMTGSFANLVGGTYWTTGKFGNAIHFGGDQDYVSGPHANYLNPLGQTVTAWIKVESGGTDIKPVFAKSDNAVCETASTLLYVGSDGRAHFDGALVGAGCIGVGGATVVTDGNWHHVAGTWDGRVLSIFVDGKLESSNQYSSDLWPMNSNTYPVLIGTYQQNSVPVKFFSGVIDNVKTYNKALSEDEINEDFLSTSEVYIPSGGSATGTITPGGADGTSHRIKIIGPSGRSVTSLVSC